jgi:hypothetical protein
MRHGSPFEAYYYIAKVQASQMKIMPASLKPGACSIAASFFKVVAERGSWGEDFIQEGEEAWESGTPGGKQLAMLKWWIAAERGLEIGQNNLAFVLDQGKLSPVPCLPRRVLMSVKTRACSVALALQTSSHQMTPQGSRSPIGHDQPRRTILMRWSKSGTITITGLAYRTSLKMFDGKKQLVIIGRR